MTLSELVELRPGEAYRRRDWPTACLGRGVSGMGLKSVHLARALGRPVAVEYTRGGWAVYRVAAMGLDRTVEDLSRDDLLADDWGSCDLPQFREWAQNGWDPPAHARDMIEGKWRG